MPLASLLRPLGYQTACIGAWHLGHRPDYLPAARGFDDFFGIPYSNDWEPPVLIPQQGARTETVADCAGVPVLSGHYAREALRFMEAAGNNPSSSRFPPHPPPRPAGRLGATARPEAHHPRRRVSRPLPGLDAGPDSPEKDCRGNRVNYRYPADGRRLDRRGAAAGAARRRQHSGSARRAARGAGPPAVVTMERLALGLCRGKRWKLHFSRRKADLFSPPPLVGLRPLPLRPPELHEVVRMVAQSYHVAPDHPEVIQEIEDAALHLLGGFGGFPVAVTEA